MPSNPVQIFYATVIRFSLRTALLCLFGLTPTWGNADDVIYTADNPPPIPEEVLRIAERSLRYNVEHRGRNPEISLTAEIVPLPIYHISAPREAVTWAIRMPEYTASIYYKKMQRLDENGGGVFLFRHWDKPPVGQSSTNYPQLKQIRKNLDSSIEIHQRFWAIKLPSWKTHIVWDPYDKEFGYWYVKIGRSGARALAVSNHLEKIKVLLRDAGLYFMREIHTSFYNLENNFYLSNIVRDPKVWGLNAAVEIWPLHALIGARMSLDWSQEEFENWALENLIPKIARAMAQLHFKYGFIPNMHTQNTLAALNAKHVLGIVLRDLSDFVLDPFIFLFRNKEPWLKKLFAVSARVNHINEDDSADVSASDNAKAGHLLASYSAPSVFHAFISRSHQSKALDRFFEIYVREILKVIDESQYRSLVHVEGAPPTVIRSRDVWADADTQSLNELLQKEYDDSEYKARAGFGFIWQILRKRLAPKVQDEMFLYDQELLTNIFDAKVIFNKLAMVDEDSASYLSKAKLKNARLAFSGEHILLVDAATNDVKIIAYGLLQNQIRHIKFTKQYPPTETTPTRSAGGLFDRIKRCISAFL